MHFIVWYNFTYSKYFTCICECFYSTSYWIQEWIWTYAVVKKTNVKTDKLVEYHQLNAGSCSLWYQVISCNTKVAPSVYVLGSKCDNNVSRQHLKKAEKSYYKKMLLKHTLVFKYYVFCTVDLFHFKLLVYCLH